MKKFIVWYYIGNTCIKTTVEASSVLEAISELFDNSGVLASSIGMIVKIWNILKYASGVQTSHNTLQ